MYRIIGITIDGKIKIQKNISIQPSKWHNTNNDIKWSVSDMYKTTLANFYNSSDITEKMKDKIDITHTWNTGDVGSSNIDNGITLQNTEYRTEKSSHSLTGPYGLAYLSDYYFAYDETGNTNCNSSSDYCKSWMIPTNIESLWNGANYEWTMTRLGLHGSGDYYAWIILSKGAVNTTSLSNKNAVRPVFYLKSDVTLKTQENSEKTKGSIDNPWIVKLN